MLSHFLTVGWAFLILVASAQASSSSASPERTVLILGDSLAAGYGIEPMEAFPTLLQNKITEAKLGFRVVNAGVSGDTSAGGLRRLNWLLKRKVDVLILELGGNDGLRGLDPAQMKANLQAIIDKTKQTYPGVRVVIAGMRMPTNLGKDYTDRYEAVFRDLATTNQAALIPFLLEGVGGRSDLNLADQIHPTAAGHKIVSETIWKTLLPVLQRHD